MNMSITSTPVVSDDGYSFDSREDLKIATGPTPIAGNVYAIPPEIWSNIFAIGKLITDESDDPANEECIGHPKEAFQLIISHTFSYFRQIALSSPQLWTSIRIDSICSLTWFIMGMDRSGTLDLDISIELITNQHLIDKVELALSIDMIILQSRRWRSLSVVYDKEFTAMVEGLYNTSVPRLRHLFLDVMDLDTPDPKVVRPIFTGLIPHLGFVRLRGFALHFFHPQLGFVVTLHLDQTKHLRLSYSTFSQMITCSPFLAHLSVYGDVIDPVSWRGSRDVMHIPSLRSLRIRGGDEDIYYGLLMGIEAPSLESLTMKELQEGDLDPLWNSGNFAKFSNVKHLAFIDFEPCAVSYLRFFAMFPGVTTFSSWAPCAESMLIKLLTRTSLTSTANTPFIPWPKLQNLTLPFTDDDEGDYEGLDMLLQNRRLLGFALSKIYLEVVPEDRSMKLILSEESADKLEIAKYHGRVVWPPGADFIDNQDIMFL